MHYMDLLGLTEEQRRAAEAALACPPESALDEAGHVRPVAALAEILRGVPALAARYEALRIPQQVLRDTLSDVPIWMNTCKRLTGTWGLLEYGWLSHHVAGRLFRLGRLQFMPQPSQVPALAYGRPGGEVATLAQTGHRYTATGEADGCNGICDPQAWTATYHEDAREISGDRITPEGKALRERTVLRKDEGWTCLLKPGDPVLDVHIPEGSPLTPVEVSASFAQAPAFFREHLHMQAVRAFTCESWLLDWALPHILPGGNVAAFGQRFYRVPHVGSDAQTMERVYGVEASRPVLTAQSSRLQRGVYAWYEKGERCRDAYGYIPLDAQGHARYCMGD